MYVSTVTNSIYSTSATSYSGCNFLQEWTGTGNTIYSPYQNCTSATTYTPWVVTEDSENVTFRKWDMNIHPSNYLDDNEYVFVPSDINYSYPYGLRVFSKEDMLQVKRAELQSNLIIQVKSRSNASQYPGEAEPERKALETLRETITEAEFRKYLRYGFVLVKGASGRTYQIFKNKSHCKVWLGGKLLEEVCVRIKDAQVPKTDNVIAFKTMIEASEENFKKLGNVYKMAV
jgi:hypothetical protein